MELTSAQENYLKTAMDRVDGRLNLFDAFGQKFPPQTVSACLKNGLIEPWFTNPMQPNWTVYRTTSQCKKILG